MDARDPAVVLWAGLLSLLLPRFAGAALEAPDTVLGCGGPCDGDPECALVVADCLLALEQVRPALDELRGAHEVHPEDGRLVRAMAVAYLELGNPAWAVKRLLTHLDGQPGDPQTRAWAVWLLVQEGDLLRAAAVLDAAPSAVPGPDAQRLALLSAAIADLEGDRAAAEAALREVMRCRDPLYPEDRALLDHLRGQVRGDPGEPLSARIQLSGGYTSNAIQSAPTDPGAELDAGARTGSPLLGVDAVVRFEPWTSRWVRPTGELRARAQGQLSDIAGDFSYADLGARAGIDLGDQGPHLLAAYSVEVLAIHGGDVYRDPGPRWFMEAHRAEIEFLPVPQLQAFVGVGRRIYRELPRTRFELDGGVAVVVGLPGGWNLTGIASGRGYNARHEAYDGFGVTGLLRLAVPLPRQGMIKVKGMVVGDRYPDSASYYLSDRPRDDVMVKAQVGPWTPPFGGFRVGLNYTFSGRHSTVESYAYTDHRVLLELRWGGSTDPLAPRPATPGDDHRSLPYGFGADEDLGLDRVQDLLRQEDSARRGSSCVD